MVRILLTRINDGMILLFFKARQQFAIIFLNIIFLTTTSLTSLHSKCDKHFNPQPCLVKLLAFTSLDLTFPPKSMQSYSPSGDLLQRGYGHGRGSSCIEQGVSPQSFTGR